MRAWRGKSFWLLPARRARSVRFKSNHSRLSVRSLLEKPTEHEHTVVSIDGFARYVRKQKNVAFAAIDDGSCLTTLQAVIPPELAQGLSTGAAVTVSGTWQKSLQGTRQDYELLADQVRVRGANDAATYPIQKKHQTPEFLRTVPHLRSRMPFNTLLLRLRSQIIADVTTFFAQRDFVQTHTPIITSSDCEGAGEVFTVAPSSKVQQQAAIDSNTHSDDPSYFFGGPRYLTVSSQLHLEALAQSVGKVWSLSPTFRAEKSDTARHLSEFYMLEAEVAFCEHLEDIMDLAEELIKFVVGRLETSKVGFELLSEQSGRVRPATSELSGIVTVQDLRRRWEDTGKGSWPRISFRSAISTLEQAVATKQTSFVHTPRLQDGLQTEHERFLVDKIGQGSPIFVTDYPKAVKPFYMAPSSDNTDHGDNSSIPTVACFDLLMPEVCEVVGGSLREHRLDYLERNMREKGMLGGSREDMHRTADPQQGVGSGLETEQDRSTLEWYLDLRRYGSLPHGGFGLGFDRLLCFLSGVSNLRDVVTFPRWHSRSIC